MADRRFSGRAEQLRSPERRERVEVERVVDHCLAGIQAARVLDIGVGSGLFAESFDRRGMEVFGIDIREEMVAAAQAYVPRGHFQEAAAESLPFGDGAVDLAFFGLILHEVDDPLAVLREARRVATVRVAILEWPYRVETFGPPLEHRLRPEVVEDVAREAGFAAVARLDLTHVQLYRLEVAPER